MKYLTYLEYIEMGGQLSENEFSRFSVNAELRIDKRTFGRFNNITEYPKELKYLIFEIVNIISSQNDYGAVASESISEGNISQSISYKNVTADEINDNISNLIQDYLSNVRVNGKCVLSVVMP